MTAINSPLVTQSSREWLDITEAQEPTSLKLTKLTKLTSNC